MTLEALRTHPATPAPLAALLLLVAGLGVRAQATLGGNLAWGQGDLAAPLLALDATVETTDGPAAPGAIPARTLVTAVTIPPAPDWFIVEKIGHRAAFSPTLVTIAAAARRHRGRLEGVRLTAGGGVTCAQRLPRAEALLEGADPAHLDLAGAIAAELVTADDPLITGPARAAIAGRVLAWHIARAFAA